MAGNERIFVVRDGDDGSETYDEYSGCRFGTAGCDGQRELTVYALRGEDEVPVARYQADQWKFAYLKRATR
jgi:hypothetical protein